MTDVARADAAPQRRPPDPPPDRRGERAALTLVTAFAAISAFIGIGRRPFWLDESLSAGATNQLVDTWQGTGGTMAGYYALLTPWSWISLDRVWLRLPSVVLALLVLPLVHHLARRLGDGRLAAFATVATAGSWAFIRYAQEARAYTLALLVTTVGWTALVRWIAAPPGSRESARWRLVFLSAAPLGLLAHGLTGLQFLAQIVTLGLLPDRRERLRAAVPAVAASLAVLLLLSWLGAGDVGSWVPPLSADQLVDLLATFTGPSAVAQVVLGCIALAGAVLAVRRHRDAPATHAGWLHAVVVVWALVPAALLIGLSLVRPYLVPRYVFGSLPAVAMLVALALHRARAHARPVVAGALVVTVALTFLAGRVQLHQEVGDDWAGAARLVAAEARPGDVVAFPTQTARPAFDYAWSELPDVADPPDVISPVGRLGDVRRLYLVHDDAEVPRLIAAAGPERVWVVGARLEGADDELEPFLDQPSLGSYEVAERHPYQGGIDVVLLRRR